MQHTSRLTQLIYRTLEWIMNLSVINLLWVLFNVPILIIILFMLFQNMNILLLLCIFAVLIVLLFFPATMAMYASIRQCVMYPEKRASIKQYWLFYKENYKRSVGIGLLLVPLWMLWYFNMFYILIEVSQFAFFSFLFIGAIYFVYNVNLFIVHVHYHYRFVELLIHTMYITFGSLTLFISIMIGFVFVVSLSLLITRTFFMLFIIFFTGALFSLISFAVFYRYYLKFSK